MQSLEHWRELNLTLGFLNYANKVQALSASMPLLLHNWKEVVDLWLDAVEVADDEALKALLEYVSCLRLVMLWENELRLWIAVYSRNSHTTSARP